MCGRWPTWAMSLTPRDPAQPAGPGPEIRSGSSAGSGLPCHRLNARRDCRGGRGVAHGFHLTVAGRHGDRACCRPKSSSTCASARVTPPPRVPTPPSCSTRTSRLNWSRKASPATWSAPSRMPASNSNSRSRTRSTCGTTRRQRGSGQRDRVVPRTTSRARCWRRHLQASAALEGDGRIRSAQGRRLRARRRDHASQPVNP